MEKERSLVLAKPDAVMRGLTGELIVRMERMGLKLVGLKMVQPTREQADTHYKLTDEWGQAVYEKAKAQYDEEGKAFPYDNWQSYAEFVKGGLLDYLTAGPVVAMVWEGVGAIPLIRKIAGKTDPFSSPLGTIRGDFAIDSFDFANEEDRVIRNLMHASGAPDEAEHEIGVWFEEGELVEYTHVLDNILYNPDALK